MDIASTAPTEAVLALLAATALPVDDLGDPDVVLFAASEAGRLLGVVGLQLLDGAALLRSLAVDPAARARGLGGRLTDHALGEARARGRTDVWLLTTTARDYFARRGFVVVPRELVAPAVRATAQFSSLCPSTAAVMRYSGATTGRAFSTGVNP